MVNKYSFRPGILELSINSVRDSSAIGVGSFVAFSDRPGVFKVVREKGSCDDCSYQTYAAKPVEFSQRSANLELTYFEAGRSSVTWRDIPTRKSGRKVA